MGGGEVGFALLEGNAKVEACTRDGDDIVSFFEGGELNNGGI